MNVFIANFTNYDINKASIRRSVKSHLAKRKAHRIIRISVIFVSASKIHKLNQEYRNKNYIPDILTFMDPLNEILICPKQATKNGHSIKYLIEHGVDHLMGNHHGKV